MNFQDPLPHSATAAPRRLTPAQKRRVTLIVSAVVIGILAVLWGFNAFRSHMMKSFFANNKPPPLAVTTEVVQPTTLPQGLTAIGSVAAVHQVLVSAEVGGKITKLGFQAGTAVKKGDLLVQLNDAAERADLAAAQAQLRLAKVSLDRSRQLVGRGFVSQAQLDQAQSQYDAATAQIGRLEAVIAQKQIRAPFDGMLGVRQVEVGQYVEPGAAMVVLTDLALLYVEFTVPEQARPYLRMEQDVTITVDAYPGQTFPGRIYVIDPQIIPDTRTIKIQAGVLNRDNMLMPGMYANVRVELPAREDVLTVAETAIDHTIYGDSVYLVVPGDAGPDGKPTLKVTRKPVTAGERANARVAVTGLKVADRVVTAGQVKLFEGAAVTLNAEPVLQKPANLPLD